MEKLKAEILAEALAKRIEANSPARNDKASGVQPGKPQQNAYVERFNRSVRYEWPSQYHREDMDHVQRFATDWMWTYNHDRPNMALDGFTPKQPLAMAAWFLLLNPVENGGITAPPNLE